MRQHQWVDSLARVLAARSRAHKDLITLCRCDIHHPCPQTVVIVSRLLEEVAGPQFASEFDDTQKYHNHAQHHALREETAQSETGAQRETQTQRENQTQKDQFRFLRWVLICHCLALVSGRHNSNVRTGEALANAWYSLPRMNRLLAGDLSSLLVTLPSLARLLHHRQVLINWQPLADLVLFAGIDENSAEAARLELFRGYSAAQYNNAAK